MGDGRCNDLRHWTDGILWRFRFDPSSLVGAMPVKPGVSMRGVRPEIVFAMAEAHAWCEKHGHEFVVTSCTEGRHSRGSRHYVGLAFDARTREMSAAEKTAFKKHMSKALGAEFDVVSEPTHLHIEFDPK